METQISTIEDPDIIMDPTYDFSFAQLFGSSGPVINSYSSAARLQSLLNSLFTPILGLEVLNVTYNDSVSKGKEKTTIFDIAATCECRDVNQVNRHTFLIVLFFMVLHY